MCVRARFCGDLGDFERGVAAFSGACTAVCSSVAFSRSFKSVWVKMKYVLVTGGVVSGLGKGVTASSIGVVLKACGLRVTSIKIGTDIVE